jgi:hypothetical protein
MGPPVILYDNEHFREILGKFEWAFFTDTSTGSLTDIWKIIMNYRLLSSRAFSNFNSQLRTLFWVLKINFGRI